MFGYKRIVVAAHERGLLIRDRSIVRVLTPGVYRLFDLLGRVSVEVFNMIEPVFDHELADVLVKERADLLERFFTLVELGEYQVGLLYKNGKLKGVLPPGNRHLFWKGLVDIDVEVLDIRDDFAVPKGKLGVILNGHLDTPVKELLSFISVGEVADNHLGLLIVDGELQQKLKPGAWAFWKFNRNVRIEQVDLRLQAMEVQGQEILTRDKVTLRINLGAQYQVVDPVLAREKLVNLADYVYRELQFALRQAVGTRSLDALLADKEDLDQVIHRVIRDKVAGFGVDVRNVGIKDVILPGDMKDILNQVVQAEKVAQANVIKRREETAATRSLLNTARLMEDNPTLMRLKELEVLEKVSEKVEKLTVFGGLDGVLNDTVRINVRGE